MFLENRNSLKNQQNVVITFNLYLDVCIWWHGRMGDDVMTLREIIKVFSRNNLKTIHLFYANILCDIIICELNHYANA